MSVILVCNTIQGVKDTFCNIVHIHATPFHMKIVESNFNKISNNWLVENTFGDLLDLCLIVSRFG